MPSSRSWDAKSVQYPSTLATSTHVCQRNNNFEIFMLTNRVLLKIQYFPSTISCPFVNNNFQKVSTFFENNVISVEVLSS